jgi:hypothetical protein
MATPQMTQIRIPQAPESAKTMDLAYTTQLVCDLAMDGMQVTLLHDGRPVHTDKVPAGGSCAFKVDLSFIRANLTLEANFDTGVLTGSGTIEVQSQVTKKFHPVFQASESSVLAVFDPCAGEVGGKTGPLDAAATPCVDSKFQGGCALATPNILRLHVDDGERFINNIGQMVKRRLFSDRPPFVFNTVASVGGTVQPYARYYTDPESDWFNLFLGYYQIDARRDQGWDRPFGYETDAGADSEVKFDDLVRLGKADWNWFSNWNYGVPLDAIEDAEDVDRRTKWDGKYLSPEEIGNTWWHRVKVERFVAASTYESDLPGDGRLRANSAQSDAWRYFFGAPCPRPTPERSFFPTKLDAELFMAYGEDQKEGVFHTYMFGGTLRDRGPVDLLQAQLTAVETVIEKCYPDLGFEAKPPEPRTKQPFGIEVHWGPRFVPSTDGGSEADPSVVVPDSGA